MASYCKYWVAGAQKPDCRWAASILGRARHQFLAAAALLGLIAGRRGGALASGWPRRLGHLGTPVVSIGVFFLSAGSACQHVGSTGPCCRASWHRGPACCSSRTENCWFEWISTCRSQSGAGRGSPGSRPTSSPLVCVCVCDVQPESTQVRKQRWRRSALPLERRSRSAVEQHRSSAELDIAGAQHYSTTSAAEKREPE